tara:strand:- start:872 stop:1036 length:165 start_codon:yes stop_codon:yes gene_type:complete
MSNNESKAGIGDVVSVKVIRKETGETIYDNQKKLKNVLENVKDTLTKLIEKEKE